LLVREFVDGLGIETRLVPNPHVTFEQALKNCKVLSLEKIAEAMSKLRDDRAAADYEMRNTEVETVTKVESVVEVAKATILQLDIIGAGRLTPPLDRNAVAEAILKWAKENEKPLWKKT
jgi:hypothetical protein